jgi:hypothetical protein
MTTKTARIATKSMMNNGLVLLKFFHSTFPRLVTGGIGWLRPCGRSTKASNASARSHLQIHFANWPHNVNPHVPFFIAASQTCDLVPDAGSHKTETRLPTLRRFLARKTAGPFRSALVLLARKSVTLVASAAFALESPAIRAHTSLCLFTEALVQSGVARLTRHQRRPTVVSESRCLDLVVPASAT